MTPRIAPGRGIDQQESYWKAKLGGDSPRLDLPVDRPRPLMPSFRRGAVSLEPDCMECRALEEICSREGTTLFTGLLSAHALLLSRTAGRHDIRVGIPCTGMVHDADGGERPFDNVVAIEIDLSGDPTVGELLRRVADAVTEGLANGDYPFEQVVEAVGGFAQPPVLQTMLITNGIASGQSASTNGEWHPPGSLRLHVARCDVVMKVARVNDVLTIGADYDSDLFDESTIRRMLEHYGVILDGMARGADSRVGALPWLTEEERDLLLVGWNATGVDVPGDVCVHHLIEEQVARTPAAVALVVREESLTYAELNLRANRLAHHLIERGVGPDVLVGVWLDRSADMLISVLAILKAGGAYLPLDPAYPASRIAYMLRDSGVTVVVTRSDLHANIAELRGAGLVLLDRDYPSTDSETDENPLHRASPDNLAYVIYTSGSTGNPKGVMVEHRNVVNFCAGMDERIGTEPGVWLSVTSLSFDISALELLWTLAHGFTVVIHTSESDAAPLQGRQATAPRPDAEIPMEFGLFYFASDEGEHAQEAGRDRYRILLDGARYADEHEFSAVWTPERHFHTFGGLYPDPAITSAAVAVITERVHIRAGSCVLPLNDPVRVAEAWSLVDNLSNGRVGVSFASGWQPEDFVFAPQQYHERHDVMFRGIETVRRLWRGETISLPGGHGREVTFGTRPRPVQPELPIWVTAGGTPGTFTRAGEVGANLLTHLLGQSIEELRDKIRLYREAWREHGHGPGDGHVTLMLHTFVGEDEDGVRAEVRGPLTRYLRGSVSLFTPFAATLGLDVNNLTEADVDALAEHAFIRYYETSGLFGTPTSCLETVERLRVIGVDELACLIDFGIPSRTVLEHLPYLNQLREMSSARVEPRAGSDYSIPALIRRHAVTHMQCTPSLAGMLVADSESAAALRNLKRLFVGGEALPASLASKLLELVPDGQIMNMYGPTETTIWSTTHTLRSDETTIPIGRPIVNTQLYIVDPEGNPVPIGVTGDLLIGGRGVVRGYLGRPELTTDRFIENPFGGAPGDRLYRTGDLARYRSDGSVEFVGRSDMQVKLRGHRVELGEIEAVLRQHVTVRDAAVVLREDVPGDPRLVAYLVGGTGGTIVVDDVRSHVRMHLPDVMIPTSWVVLDALPLTPNAKIDRRALPAPAVASSGLAATYIPPRNATEEMIEEIWRDVLKLPRIGMQDNFFELGGHSILVIHVLNRLRTRLDRDFSMTDMFTFPTIRSLAEYIGEVDGASASA